MCASNTNFIAPKKQTIAILGLGLLGTSLGKALDLPQYHRIVWTRNTQNCYRALEDNIADEIADSPEAAAQKADITVMCVPVTEIVRLIPILKDQIKENAILTDVGSAKGLIMKTAGPLRGCSKGFFIGSHPMAGTEYSGYDSCVDGLYQGAPVFVTPMPNPNEEITRRICDFWKSIGANPIVIDPAFHDKIVAHTSHISHIIAMTLTRTVLDCPENEKQYWYQGCAGGFRDTTRIASSVASMWRTIIEQNQAEVLDAMNNFESKWNEVKHDIETGNFDAFEQKFSEGRNAREEWLKNRYQIPPQKTDCK